MTLLFTFVGSTLAVDSGPTVGEDVPELKIQVLGANSDYAEQDVAAPAKKFVQVYCFVNGGEWSRPMSRFVRGVDKALSEQGGGAGQVAIWVSDDNDAAKEYLPRGRDALKLGATSFGYDTGDASGPEGWGINSDASLTVVVAHQGKVMKTFAYISVNETDVPAVVKAVKATLP